MPTPITDPGQQGGQNLEWSETLHAFLFRARIYLKRYWWIFVLTISGGIGMQAWRQYNSKPVYESHAQMMLRSRVPAVQGQVVEDLVGFWPTQLTIMRSSGVLNAAYDAAATQNPDLAATHPSVNPQVSQMVGTSFLSLSVTGSNPTFTQLYLKCWMDAFLNFKKQQNDKYILEAQNAQLLQAERWDTKVTQLQAQLEAFNKQNNIFTISEEVKTSGSLLSNIMNRLGELESQERFLKSLNDKAYMEGEKSQDIEVVDRGMAGVGLAPVSQDYPTLKQRLLHLMAEYDDRDNDLKDTHPLMLALLGDINQLKNKLKVLRSQTATSLRDRLADVTADITRTNEDKKAAQTRAYHAQELQGRFDQINSQLQVAQANSMNATLTANQMDVSKIVDQSMFDIFPPGPSDPVEMAPNPVKQMGEGAFIGLIAGAMLIFLLGALDGRVMSVEDITQRFDEPMLGVIPMQKRIDGKVELLKSNDQRQMFAEACRNIRSSLLYMDRQGKRPRTIVLTSSVPAEGKSTLSANLAITLGFAASRTLLVDADLRRGQLHKQFGMSNAPGLAEHIQDGVPIDEVIRPTGFENLDFIPGGHYPSQPGELLMTERFRETMEALKKRYDFIIFDSPPILATDDAGSFATRTDAVIFVVRAGYTRLRQVRTSLESLHRRGVNIYGLIVNFIDHREPGYYSYKYYDYYSYQPARPQPGREASSSRKTPVA